MTKLDKEILKFSIQILSENIRRLKKLFDEGKEATEVADILTRELNCNFIFNRKQVKKIYEK